MTHEIHFGPTVSARWPGQEKSVGLLKARWGPPSMEEAVEVVRGALAPEFDFPHPEAREIMLACLDALSASHTAPAPAPAVMEPETSAKEPAYAAD